MTRLVDPRTQTFGVGAVTLDCELARAHGWTEDDLEAAAADLQGIALLYGRRARRRYPNRYADDGGGVVVFIGELPRER